ncbi:MAG TPA: hypothetical protein VGZ47_13095 [Gemmataceae bacterium]|nr:hypothetical protein [Gemmataceae bacterium]
MLATQEWEFAIIDQDVARKAQVDWVPGRRLPGELIPTAIRLGYTASELETYSIGELRDDLVTNNAIYVRGAIVLPDEQGHPAALFGKPLVKSPNKSCGTNG